MRHRTPARAAAGQAEDVRVELAGVNDAGVDAPAPPRERQHLPHAWRPAEAANRERRDRGDAVRDERFEGPPPMEARDVDFELRPVEPTHQLDHLTLGSADVETGQQESDWIWTTCGTRR